mmetsp:Transcript_1328/g.2869  ORF Transcript_1328/g.2869 Transcript_1328/m.2869 type:complete len:114 (+) Transcript_1328:52-393(+)
MTHCLRVYVPYLAIAVSSFYFDTPGSYNIRNAMLSLHQNTIPSRFNVFTFPSFAPFLRFGRRIFCFGKGGYEGTNMRRKDGGNLARKIHRARASDGFSSAQMKATQIKRDQSI